MAEKSTIGTSGSCACGRIKFTTTEPQSLGGTYCHCKQCQKVSGCPFLSFAGFKSETVTWTPEPDLWRFSNIAKRGFCSNCGSCLSMQYSHAPNRVGIVYGVIDQSSEPIPPPMEHIFLKEKASWYTLPDDGLPRYDGFDPPFQKRLEAWLEKEGLNDRKWG